MTDHPRRGSDTLFDVTSWLLVGLSGGLLTWPHRRGAAAHCLARVGLLAAAFERGATRAVVVFSELRDNPRGLGVTADVAGVGLAARRSLLPASVADAVDWYVHHGAFSTFDPAPAGETFTRVAPNWDGTGYRDDPHDHRLLSPDAGAELAAVLRLRPVEHDLALFGSLLRASAG